MARKAIMSPEAEALYNALVDTINPPPNADAMRSNMRNVARWFAAHAPGEAINREWLESYCDGRLAEGAAEATVMQELSIIRRASDSTHPELSHITLGREDTPLAESTKAVVKSHEAACFEAMRGHLFEPVRGIDAVSGMRELFEHIRIQPFRNDPAGKHPSEYYFLPDHMARHSAEHGLNFLNAVEPFRDRVGYTGTDVWNAAWDWSLNVLDALMYGIMEGHITREHWRNHGPASFVRAWPMLGLWRNYIDKRWTLKPVGSFKHYWKVSMHRRGLQSGIGFFRGAHIPGWMWYQINNNNVGQQDAQEKLAIAGILGGMGPEHVPYRGEICTYRGGVNDTAPAFVAPLGESLAGLISDIRHLLGLYPEYSADWALGRFRGGLFLSDDLWRIVRGAELSHVQHHYLLWSLSDACCKHIINPDTQLASLQTPAGVIEFIRDLVVSDAEYAAALRQNGDAVRFNHFLACFPELVSQPWAKA